MRVYKQRKQILIFITTQPFLIKIRFFFGENEWKFNCQPFKFDFLKIKLLHRNEKKNLLPNIRINQSSLLVYLLLISSSFFSYIHVILFSTININFFYLNIYVSTIFFRFNPKTNQKKKPSFFLAKKIYIYKQKQQHYENIQYVFDVVCFNTIFIFIFPKKLNFKTGNDVEG